MQCGVSTTRQRIQRREEDEERLRRSGRDGDEQIGRGVGEERD